MNQDPINSVQGSLPEQGPEPTNTPPPVQNGTAANGGQSGQPEKKSKKPLIITIIVIAVIGLCIGGFFLYKHFSDDNSGSKKDKKSRPDSSQTENISNDAIDLTDYDAEVEEATEPVIEYDGPEESELTQLSLSHDDNGDFQFLSGSFDAVISSSDDAQQFIADNSEDIGISDAYSELSFFEEKTHNGVTYYKFKQVYQGVPVYGNELIVTVNSEGKVSSVSGTYTPVEVSVSTSKEMNKKAEETAKEYAGDNAEILSDELTILPRTESGSPKLVYDIKAIGETKSAELFIDAESGEIVSEEKLFNSLSETFDVDVNGSKYNVELEKVELDSDSPQFYNIYDPIRDISVSNAGLTSYTLATVSNGFFGGFSPLYAEKKSENSDGSVVFDVYEEHTSVTKVSPITAQYAFGSLSSTEKAYDYYDQKLGWKSIDGNGMPLKLIVGVKETFANVTPESTGNTVKDIVKLIGLLLPSLKDRENAAYVKDTNLVLIGAVNDTPLVGNGILGHEYTHGVINNIAHLRSSVQAGTINEGYADVIGSIIAGDWEFMAKEVPTDWEYYKSSLRSAVDPNKFGDPAIKDTSDEYYSEYPRDAHDNASIVSHTAYLMTQNGISNDRVAELFFGSMFQLSSNPDFEEASLAVIKAADLLSYSKDDLHAVVDALIETKMLEPDGTITINVHCGNHVIADAEVTIDGTVVGKTDDEGNLAIEWDPKWIGDIEIMANADGFNSLTQTVTLLGDDEDLDFNLAVNRSFGAAHGSDPDKRGEVSGEKVTVTILEMSPDGTSSHAKEKAQDYYVQKGSKISLQKLVDAMGMAGVTTDGTKIYFDTGYVPVELSYHIYGTDEVFDFSKPIYENVVIEPVVGIGGFDFNGEGLEDLAQELDDMFNGGGLY